MSSPPYFDYGQSFSAALDVWRGSLADEQTRRETVRQRLASLLALVRAESPFYRRHYRGVDTQNCQLSSLPPVTRSDLVSHLDEVVTDQDVTRARLDAFLADHAAIGTPFLGRYAVWSSSGTTGEPGAFLHDGHALAVYDALQLLRFRAGAPLRITDRYALVGAIDDHFAGVATIERLRWLQPWLAARIRSFSLLAPLRRLAEELNAYQPTLLATYATAAGLLADARASGQLAVSPREIWVGGECLSDGDRARIQHTFGCPVREEYGASEFLSIACSCPRGALHVNTDWVVLEALDAQGRSVAPGTPSHTTLLTNLANRVQPLVRYDLGDSITWLDTPCACGSRFPILRVQGRLDEVVVLHDSDGNPVKLLPLALTTVLEDDAAIYRFQLRRSAGDALTLDLEPDGDEDAPRRCRMVLERFLGAQGLHPRLEIRRRPLRPHPHSGKLQRVFG